MSYFLELNFIIKKDDKIKNELYILIKRNTNILVKNLHEYKTL